MSTILVPLDFSDCAPRVLAEAVRFARAFHARLLLLHASEAPRGLPLNALVQPSVGGVAQPVAKILREDAEAHLVPLVEAARAAGVEARAVVTFGSVAEVVLDTAAREEVAMILMGTHGRSGISRAVLGSVAEDVVRHSDVPVITVRARHGPSCAASRCASCEQGRSEVERMIAAQELG